MVRGATFLGLAMVICNAVGAAPPLTLLTSDSLSLSLDSETGLVNGLALDGAPQALVPGGGLSLRVGDVVTPATLASFDFDTGASGLAPAQNANWNTGTSYYQWHSTGGSTGGYVSLGDGATAGAGMALAAPIPAAGESSVRIEWKARSADTATKQILAVRLYNSSGTDITSTVGTATSPWVYSSTSQANVVYGMTCDTAGAWQSFSYAHPLSDQVASVGVSLRVWQGGSLSVDVDDLRVSGSALHWTPVSVQGPFALQPDGSAVQDVMLSAQGLSVRTTARADAVALHFAFTVRETGEPLRDIPLVLRWTLPADLAGWTWWDDLEDRRAVQGPDPIRNTIQVAGHPFSLYPYAAVSSGGLGLSLSVPMDEVVPQRFESSLTQGLSSAWEILLPADKATGPAGQATLHLSVWRHDGEWGFRSASARYQALHPDVFQVRVPRHGTWLYPLAPGMIPNPSDFGFAYYEMTSTTIAAPDAAVAAANGIGVYPYVEPWLAWQNYGTDSVKPSIGDRLAKMQQWAANPGSFHVWHPSDGEGGTGYLRLGDGVSPGAGMAFADRVDVPAGTSVRIEWNARVSDVGTLQIPSVRAFDSTGTDITPTTPAPSGWGYSPVSKAHIVAGLPLSAADAWQAFSKTYAVPTGAASIQLSLRHWNGGDHWLDIDTVRVTRFDTSVVLREELFDTAPVGIESAQNDVWHDAHLTTTWLRVPRQTAASAVLSSVALDAAGLPQLDYNSYYWHEWGVNSWNQAWPLNPDPDDPNGIWSVWHDASIFDRLAGAEGVYFDSVELGGAVGGWADYNVAHLRLADQPPTFDPSTGAPVLLAPQAHAKYFSRIEQELRAQDKLLMLNLFPDAGRFHGRFADVLGSEVSDLREPDRKSRLRRAMAGPRVVTNLLQFAWGRDSFITPAEMEEYLRGQLAWGFFPGVSSGGGVMSGGTPNRYFLHPELYERDRPLFQHYIPAIRQLSEAGWRPVTGARLAGARIERFGDLADGAVYLTIQAPLDSPLSGSVVAEPARWDGGSSGALAWEVVDLLGGGSFEADRATSASPLLWNVDLATSSVLALRIQPVSRVPGTLE